jgi:hypothetical protein
MQLFSPMVLWQVHLEEYALRTPIRILLTLSYKYIASGLCARKNGWAVLPLGVALVCVYHISYSKSHDVPRIFIVEGILTVLVGLSAMVLMFDWPSATKRLTKADKALLRSRMKTDGETTRMDRLDGKAIKRIASDWKIYIGFGILKQSFGCPTR